MYIHFTQTVTQSDCSAFEKVQYVTVVKPRGLYCPATMYTGCDSPEVILVSCKVLEFVWDGVDIHTRVSWTNLKLQLGSLE